MERTAKCDSCGAEIIWIKDQKDKRLPVNKRRVRVYDQTLSAGWHFKEALHTDDARLFYISHFITCPNATQHSKENTND